MDLTFRFSISLFLWEEMNNKEKAGKEESDKLGYPTKVATGAKGPGAKLPGAKCPGAKCPGAKCPGAKNPGTKCPIPPKSATHRHIVSAARRP